MSSRRAATGSLLFFSAFVAVALPVPAPMRLASASPEPSESVDDLSSVAPLLVSGWVRERDDRAGGLAGSLLFPDGIDVRHIQVTIVRQDGLGCSPRLLEVDPQDGSFEAASLAVGFVRLVVAAEADPEDPIAVVPWVEIRRDEVNREPRLRGIDLRNVLWSFTIRAIDGGGDPLEGVWVRRLERSYRVHDRTDADGKVTIVSSWPTVDVELAARGRRTRRVLGLACDATVILDPAIALRVEIEAPPELVPRLADFTVSLRFLNPVEGSKGGVRLAQFTHRESARSTEDGVCAFQAREAGRHRVHVSFPDVGDARGRWFVAEPDTIDVPDLPEATCRIRVREREH
jgi:hypothetical protein